MTLTELRYIVTLAQEQHFGRAAERCHVSQPTLSVGVKKLEDELGVLIFERSKSAVRLTPVGEGIVTQAQKVLEQACLDNDIPAYFQANQDFHVELQSIAGNRWLLTPALGEDVIRIYRIGETGLTAHTTVSVRAGSGPRHPVFSPNGRHVWCLNELDGTIDMFDFDADAGGLAMRQSVNMLPPGFGGGRGPF